MNNNNNELYVPLLNVAKKVSVEGFDVDSTVPAFRYIKNSEKGLKFRNEFEKELFNAYGDQIGLNIFDSVSLVNFLWSNFSTVYEMETLYNTFGLFLVNKDNEKDVPHIPVPFDE